MKERPILFSTPMVQALLAGRKTQTRRITHDNGETLIGYEYVTDVPIYPEYWKGKKGDAYTGWVAKFSNLPIMMPRSCRFGEVGDVLWVRETFKYIDFAGEDNGYVYRASENGKAWESTEDWIWKPSIHMPKCAARIWLEITNIRAERLQEISEADAITEGIEQNDRGYKDYINGDFGVSSYTSFRTLWKKINGPDSWNANPWVWAIAFKVLSTIGKLENV